MSLTEMMKLLCTENVAYFLQKHLSRYINTHKFTCNTFFIHVIYAAHMFKVVIILIH